MTAATDDFDTFAPPWEHGDPVRITGIRPIVTAPEGIPLVVVRVDTDVAGLYGLGCATFTQRWRSVVELVSDYLPRLVVGRHAGDIRDLGRLVRFSGYWREGPVSNNALSGMDMALWDIAGKRAGMPVYELIGGRVRAAADAYAHAAGTEIEDAVEAAARLAEQGWGHIRVQAGQTGVGGYGATSRDAITDPSAPYPRGWSVADYLRQVPALLGAARDRLGDRVELLHDSHSRLAPSQAVALCRSVEDVRPFFLEDVLAPELWEALPAVRSKVGVPLAVGELATSFSDAARLVTSGAVDFLRCHPSMVGGFTAALQLSTLCEINGVRTAWHNPGDLSPIGAAANVTLDVCSPAFGIQESHVFSARAAEVFPGTIGYQAGRIAPNESPGWGVDLDEAAAAHFPPGDGSHDRWAAGVRGLDGALIAP